MRVGERAGDLTATTQAYVGVVERFVRERPELWLWSHRRFRWSAPPMASLPEPGEAPSEPGPIGA